MRYLILSGSAFLVLDQWTKRMVQLRSSNWNYHFIGSVVRLRVVTSSKRVYRSDIGRAAMVIIWLAALLSVLALHQTGVQFRSCQSLIGVGCALGGAAGNLSDVLRRGGVIDFIDLRWWPVFNLADVGIVVGLLLAFLPLRF